MKLIYVYLQSLPSWECGLKSFLRDLPAPQQSVTPFVGVWIEIGKVDGAFEEDGVTPFVGVWIEI